MFSFRNREAGSLWKWSWRGSNPRPNKWQMCFLHAYSVIACRGYSGRGHPRHTVASKISPAARGRPSTIPYSRAPPGHQPTGGVGGRCLVPAASAGIKLTYCTSVKQQERSYFRQLSFCIGFQGCWCVSLHAYKSPSLLSKPVSPEASGRRWPISLSICHPLLGYCGKKRESPTFEDSLSRLAVRTRLELATPCVTGMYSNQTELPDRWHPWCKRTLLFLKCGCKSTTFFQYGKEKNHFSLKKNL